MFELPITLNINNNEFKLRNRADYRTILDAFNAFNDYELEEEERIYAGLIILFEDLNGIEDIYKLGDLSKAFEEINLFLNCGQKSIGHNTSFKAIDWEQDAQLIASAVNNVAKTEIRSVEYCHWWTFMGYYLSIGDSPLSTIVSIRSKLHKGKKLEKWEQEFKRDNPEYFTARVNKADKAFIEDFLNRHSLLNKEE